MVDVEKETVSAPWRDGTSDFEVWGSGQNWIRTSEGVSQRIYSPPRLATSVSTLSRGVGGYTYLAILTQGFRWNISVLRAFPGENERLQMVPFFPFSQISRVSGLILVARI